jgi:Ran GTPase-activating protein (RanGAP) involved in mRNA processing and transport
MVSGNQALVELILRDVGLDGSNVDLLAEAIDKGKNLTYLDISSNIGLNTEGGTRILSRHLGHLKRLKQLDINGCKLGPEGCKLVCEALCKNTTINQLSLNSNDIRDLGAEAVAHLLLENNTITHLSIQSNGIRNAGIQSIANGVASNKTLVSLNFAWNDMDNGGCVHLIEAIRINVQASGSSCALKALFLFGNRVDEIYAGILAASVQYNQMNYCINPVPLELDVNYAKMKVPAPKRSDEQENTDDNADEDS